MKGKHTYEIVCDKEERAYRFTCNQDSPLGHIYEVLTQMRDVIGQRIELEEKRIEAEKCQEKDKNCEPEALEVENQNQQQEPNLEQESASQP